MRSRHRRPSGFVLLRCSRSSGVDIRLKPSRLAESKIDGARHCGYIIAEGEPAATSSTSTREYANYVAGKKDQNVWRNSASDFATRVDVGFCQIGKSEKASNPALKFRCGREAEPMPRAAVGRANLRRITS